MEKQNLLTIGIVFFLLAAVGSANSGRASELTALTQCPTTYSACMPMSVTLIANDGRRSVVDQHPLTVRVSIPEGEDYGTATLKIRGHLNGGEAMLHKLVLSYPQDLLGCHDFTVATLGVGQNGGGTIVTNQGELEVLDEAFQLGDESVVFTINPDTLKGRYHRAPGWEKYAWPATPSIQWSGDVFWKRGNACVGPLDDDRFRSFPEPQCNGVGELVEATPQDVEAVSQSGVIHDQGMLDRLHNDLWRHTATDRLMYIWGAACT